MFIKAICIALTLTFGGGVIASVVMADSGCGMKCCCLSKSMSRHHTTQEQIRSSTSCCSGSAQMPCDLVSAVALRLPEVTLASAPGHQPTVADSTGNFSDDLSDWYGFRGRAFDQSVRENFRSPPLYLQNLSFLI
jgi:hypothetical protein